MDTVLPSGADFDASLPKGNLIEPLSILMTKPPGEMDFSLNTGSGKGGSNTTCFLLMNVIPFL